MRQHARSYLWLLALALALIVLARQVRVVFVVRMGWLQLLGTWLLLAVLIYLLVDLILSRLRR
jgi:hypothetical protein